MLNGPVLGEVWIPWGRIFVRTNETDVVFKVWVSQSSKYIKVLVPDGGFGGETIIFVRNSTKWFSQ